MGINTFKQNFQQLARPSRFKVLIQGIVNDTNSMLCINAEMPGISFNTETFHDANDSITSAPYEVPVDVIFKELALTFMDTPDYRIRRSFENWALQVFDPNKGFGYLDEFKKPVNIWQVKNDGTLGFGVVLENAWPKSIDAIAFDATGQSQYTQLGVQIAYNYYRVIN